MLTRTSDAAPLTHRTVLALAIPVMLSNLSTPLTGIVATGVVGRIPGAAPIGAVAAGSLIFDLVFWGFGFLRMGTTGLTAQARGAQDADELRGTLGRALLCALAIGAVLILLQWPIRAAAFGLLGAGPQVERLARQYFDVRIWAAPATLANYAILGWLIGLGRTQLALVVQLVLNVTNMLLALLLSCVCTGVCRAWQPPRCWLSTPPRLWAWVWRCCTPGGSAAPGRSRGCCRCARCGACWASTWTS